MGTPAPSDAADWRAMRSVVSRRLVNVFSENDNILALYRTSAIQFRVAGIQEVEDVKGVENVNATSIVSGHLRYQHLVGSILQKIGWEDIDVNEAAQEEETLSLLEDDEKKQEKERAGKVDGEDEQQSERDDGEALDSRCG